VNSLPCRRYGRLTSRCSRPLRSLAAAELEAVRLFAKDKCVLKIAMPCCIRTESKGHDFDGTQAWPLQIVNVHEEG